MFCRAIKNIGGIYMKNYANYAKPSIKIVYLGNEVDVITESSGKDNLLEDCEWDLTNSGFSS